MTPFGFHTAASLVVGRGCTQQLGSFAQKMKYQRIVVVTDRNLLNAGVVDRVVKPLHDSGIDVELFLDCVAEPPVEVIRSVAAMAKDFHPDALLGLGGGSNMDAAKLAAVILAHGKDPLDWVGDSRVPGPVFPLICVPTTAGTGSEVSAAAVFTDTAKKIKVSTLSPYLRPTLALVDSLLTVGCPKQVTADSGIDALTHAIEAFTAVHQAEFLSRAGGTTVYQGKNPIADAMAVECIRLVQAWLKRAVIAPDDLDARDGMALAGTLGGLAFSNAGVALVHAMEYPVGGAVHVSHGAGNGLLLPYVMRYNRPAQPRAFDALDAMFGGDAVEAIEQLRLDIGIPTRLRDLGVTEAMLPEFAEKAFAIKRLLRVNPRSPASAEELLDVYRSAF